MATGLFAEEGGVTGVGVGGHGHIEWVFGRGLDVVDAVVLNGKSGLEDGVARSVEGIWEDWTGFSCLRISVASASIVRRR